MMKKTVALLLAVVLCCSLAACGGTSAAKELDLTAFYENEIAAKYELPGMMAVEGEYIDAFYPGLSALELKQQVLYMPMMNVHATEFLLVEAQNEEDAQKVEEIFAQRLSDLDATWSMYLPEQYALVETAQVLRTGNFVTLIVSDYQSEIESALADALK